MDPNHLPSLKLPNSSRLKIGFPKRKSNWVSTPPFGWGDKTYMSFTFGAGWFHSNIFWYVHTPDPWSPMIQFDLPAYFSTRVGFIQVEKPTNQVRQTSPWALASGCSLQAASQNRWPQRWVARSSPLMVVMMYLWMRCQRNQSCRDRLGCFFSVRKQPRNVCVCVSVF